MPVRALLFLIHILETILMRFVDLIIHALHSIMNQYFIIKNSSQFLILILN